MASEREAAVAFQKLNSYFGQIYKAQPDPIWLQLGKKVPSDDLTENFAWPGGTPRMQRQKGEDVRSDIHLYTHSLSNEKFYMSIPIAEIFLITGKVGTLLPTVGEMAVAATTWAADNLRDVVSNFASYTGYDGKPLFSATHKDGKQTQSNIVTGAGLTAANLSTDLAKVQAAKAQFTDDRGNIVGNAAIDTVVIPPNPTLIESWLVVAGGRQAEGQADWSGNIKRVIVNSDWAAADKDWAAFETGGELQALLWTELLAPTTAFIDHPERSGDKLFEVKSFGQFGPGNWRRAVYVDVP
jgi:hypothetical protein